MVTREVWKVNSHTCAVGYDILLQLIDSGIHFCDVISADEVPTETWQLMVLAGAVAVDNVVWETIPPSWRINGMRRYKKTRFTLLNLVAGSLV